ADDTSRQHVLDGAEIELALVGGELGWGYVPLARNVGQPQFVDVIGGEVTLDQAIVDRRSRALTILGPLLAEAGPPLVVSADSPCGPLGHHLTRFCVLADQVPGAQLGTVTGGG